MGAVAGLGAALKLSEVQLVNALGIAGSMAGGDKRECRFGRTKRQQRRVGVNKDFDDAIEVFTTNGHLRP